MTIRSIDRLKLTGIMLAVLIAAIACTSATSTSQQDEVAPADTGNSVATTVPAANPASSGNGSTSNGDAVTTDPVAPVAVIEGDAAVEQATGALFLQMTSPVSDELFVTQSSYEFKGRTTVDALLSVNDSVLEVDEEGRFAFAMDLDEGPNVIEVVASNSLGEQFDEVLLVIYEPV
jgi:hypothetical protein